MAGGSESDTQESVLSDSWTNLSDADYSIDDDLRSETTDAASVTDQAGLERVHSFDTSDVGSQGTSDEGQLSSSFSRSKISAARRDAMNADSVDTLQASHMERSIILEDPRTKSRAEFGQLSQVIDTFDEKEAYSFSPRGAGGSEGRHLTGTVCMALSDKPFIFHEPFRLLYVGETKARRQILTKLGDVLMSDTYRKNKHFSLQSSSYLVRPSDGSSSVTQPDLVPIKTQIVVDDCTTTASITDDKVHKQIFLTFKNGSLFSSRWNGSSYEVSSASKWMQPDLAVFVVAPDCHPIVKQRHQLAYEFVSRHQIPILIISETMKWDAEFDYLPIDVGSPHLQVEARRNDNPMDCEVVKSLPIDLETFMCLHPEQLNKGLAHLATNATEGHQVGLPVSASVSTQQQVWDFMQQVADRGRTLWGQVKQKGCSVVSGHDVFWRSVLMTLIAILSLAFSAVACKVMVSMFAYMFAPNMMGLPEVTPLVMGSPTQIGSTATPVCSTPTWFAPVCSVKVAAQAKPTDAVSKDIISLSVPSELARFVKQKSLGAPNQLERFEVHTIGDCDILIKLPRKFKSKGNKTPFQVVVSRNGKVIDSSLSKLFEGVYAARIETKEAFGLLNVTIEKDKSSKPEVHMIDFGLKLLNLARLRQLGQIASEQLYSRLDSASDQASASYEWLATEVFPRAQDASRLAAQRAQDGSLLVRAAVKETGRVLGETPAAVRKMAKYHPLFAYRDSEIRKEVDQKVQSMIRGARSANKASQSTLRSAQLALNDAFNRLRENSLPTSPFPNSETLLNQMKSKRLARAQARLQRVLDQVSKRANKRKSKERKKKACSARNRNFWGR